MVNRLRLTNKHANIEKCNCKQTINQSISQQKMSNTFSITCVTRSQRRNINLHANNLSILSHTLRVLHKY